MLKQRTKSLRDRTVVTAAILSLMSGNTYAGGSPIGGASTNDRKTDSPIKHLIVILGENRTFDHLFATYVPRDGEHVDNLLSKGIINKDGSPGPNYAKAAQFSTTVNNFYSINPTPKTPYTRFLPRAHASPRGPMQPAHLCFWRSNRRAVRQLRRKLRGRIPRLRTPPASGRS